MQWNDLKFYVYVLLDPRKPGEYKYGELEFDFEPYYVGKGSGCRVLMHTWGATNEEKYLSQCNKLKAKKILEILKDPTVKYTYKIIYQGLTEEEAFIKEIECINSIGMFIYKKGPLLNMDKGGAGGQWLDNPSKPKGPTFLGKKHSEETKKKLSEALKGREAWNKGLPRTEEVKQKLRKPHPQTSGENNPSKRLEVRKKLSEGKLGSNNPRSRQWIITNGQDIWIFKGGINTWCKEHHTTRKSLIENKSKDFKIIKEDEIVYYKGKIFRD